VCDRCSEACELLLSVHVRGAYILMLLVLLVLCYTIAIAALLACSLTHCLLLSHYTTTTAATTQYYSRLVKLLQEIENLDRRVQPQHKQQQLALEPTAVSLDAQTTAQLARVANMSWGKPDSVHAICTLSTGAMEFLYMQVCTS
jgi:hypothetical protein